MSETTELDELRALVGTARAPGSRYYPKEVRTRLLEYAERRGRQGVRAQQVALEVGLKPCTLRSWQAGARKPGKRRLRRVELEVPSSRQQAVVHGPGVRIEGLDVDGVAALLRKLRS